MPEVNEETGQHSAPEGGNALARDIDGVLDEIREGRFQRSLALLAGGASLMSGLEVAYEHYRGSYSQRIMYTPVILSGALGIAGVAGFCSGTAARTVLRATSAVTLVDALVGFFMHVRGIARKPGGWRLPVTNIIMGPPIFAPLLFGTAAYLGLIASYLRREGTTSSSGNGAQPSQQTASTRSELQRIEQDVREGRFQQHMLAATAFSAVLSGSEAWYSHYKNGFRYASQWAPVVLAPVLALVCVAAVKQPKLAKTAVPALSAAAIGVSGIGFSITPAACCAAPVERSILLYNIMYGPPIFAPLLFGAAGSLGILASLLRRSKP